jgi:hypothetical protein
MVDSRFEISTNLKYSDHLPQICDSHCHRLDSSLILAPTSQEKEGTQKQTTKKERTPDEEPEKLSSSFLIRSLEKWDTVEVSLFLSEIGMGKYQEVRST